MTITTGAALAPDDDAAADDASGHPGISVDSGISLDNSTARETGITLAIAPDVVTDSPLAVAVAREGPSGARPHADRGTEADDPLLSVLALSTTETPPAPPPVPLAERLRSALPFTGPGLTGLGGALLGCLVVGLGAESDLALGAGLGLGFTATFLLGCVLVAAALRTRALGVAVVLPPLLFAGGYTLEMRSSGQTAGRREMALDVATSLALHAPLLFLGTAMAAAIVLGRVIVHLVRR